MSDERYVIVGRIVGVFGVRGWVKVHSYTSPSDNLLGYHPWFIIESGLFHERELQAGQSHGKGLVALLSGCIDPTSARCLVGREVAVPREILPLPEEGEYYWADLIDLRVVTLQGVELGKVKHLIETGANDVFVVHGERERLIPYLPGTVVCEVDLVHGQMVVDWDPEF
jgi:16S rRNA processing protein RimM